MSLACPRCGSDQVRSASLHAHDGLRHMLFSTALRCRDCRHRFWVANPLKPVGLFLIVSALVGATAWFTVDRQPDAIVSQAPNKLPHTRAAQGDAEAQLQLGLRYAEGDGVIRNDKEAARWFALAARQGLSEAEYHYGLMLLKGRGVVQDYRAAFEWIEKPAKRGYARAQYSLGELYRYGTGTPIDKAHAYLWFNLAASQGIDAAAKARDSLVWQLKPEQIAEMQEEARRMTHTPHPAAVTPAPLRHDAEAGVRK